MSIQELSFNERSLLFAKLSKIAYYDAKDITKQAKSMGFTTVEFYDIQGAQAYRFMNKHDLVIACRGTQPTEYNDIAADANALPVIAETVSRVHAGFKQEVDELWPLVLEDLQRTVNDGKHIWFCGHSLGAAMATIMASRCHLYPEVDPVQEIYTYGSPRVGWPEYVQSLGIKHHRWVNNNDIVCRVPLWLMGYRHHGTEHYLNAYGLKRNPTGWQRVKDRFRGMWMGMKKGKIDNFSDHNIGDYINHIEKLK